MRDMRVLIVSENASTRFGGEAILPWHYFRLLRERGIEAWLLTHERCRAELTEALPGEADRMHFVPDSKLQYTLWRIGSWLPARIDAMTFYSMRDGLTGKAFRKLAQKLVGEHDINVVHEPAPVSPRKPSAMYSLAVPVIIGPMNGNMTYPPAMRSMGGWTERIIVPAARLLAPLMNRIKPGKREAARLLVANTRTQEAIPVPDHGQVRLLVENGVDLSLWDHVQTPDDANDSDEPVRFVYLGRLVDWKAVDVLIHAMAKPDIPKSIQLDIIGDGDERAMLESLCAELNVTNRVRFLGFLPQHECVSHVASARALVLPSLYECGGAVVLEAMAMSRPVIATNWGGPADYLDEECGMLIEPTSKQDMIENFAKSITELASDLDLANRMGRVGRTKIETQYDWQRKLDAMIEHYQEVIEHVQPTEPS